MPCLAPKVRMPSVVVTTLLSLATPALAQGTPTPNAAALRADYRAFTAAVLKQDGEAAAKYVTSGTLEVYERCRKLALDSEGKNLAELPQIDVLMVFQLRYLLSAAELKRIDAKALFAWGVKHGLVSRETFQGIELADVEVRNNNTGTAKLTKNSTPVNDLVFHFTKGDAHWQLDMQKVMAAAEPTLEKLRAETGKGKVELAVFLLERTHKKKIPPAILDGPLNREPPAKS